MVTVRQRAGIQPLRLGSIPNLLAWIELWGIAGQIIQRQPSGVLASKVFYGSRSVSRSPVYYQEDLSLEEMAMKRLYESDKSFGIEIASGQLEEQMSGSAHCGSNSYVNAALSRDSGDRSQVWKRLGFSNMRDKNKKALVSVKENSSHTSARTKYPRQNFLFPLANCPGSCSIARGSGTFCTKPSLRKNLGICLE